MRTSHEPHKCSWGPDPLLHKAQRPPCQEGQSSGLRPELACRCVTFINAFVLAHVHRAFKSARGANS